MKRILRRGLAFLLALAFAGSLMGCQAFLNASDKPMTVERLQKELMGTYRIAEGVAYSMTSSSFPEWLDRDYLGKR